MECARATEHAKRALEIFERIGDVSGAANALNNLAYHAFYVGAWGECEQHHRAALAARSDIGDVLGRALASYNLGELFMEQGRFDESTEWLTSALADFRGAGHLVGESATRIALGRLDARLGRSERSLDQFERAEAVARSASGDEQLVDAAFGRCELALLNGDAAPSDSLASIDVASLSPVQHARFDLVSAIADRSHPDRLARLRAAQERASEVGAIHLVQLASEALARITGSELDRALRLSESLGMTARPVFRL